MKIFIAVSGSSSFSDLLSTYKDRISIVKTPELVNGLSLKEKIYKYIKLIQDFGIPKETIYNAIWVKKKLFAENDNYPPDKNSYFNMLQNSL